MKKALKYTKMLEEVRLTREQAEVHLNILSDVFEEDLATKADIDNLHFKIDGVESRLDARIDHLEAKMDAKFDAMEAKFDALDTKFEVLEQKMTVKLGSLIIAGNVAMLTLFKYVL